MKNFVFDLYGTLVDIRTDEQNAKFRKSFAKYFAKYNPDCNFWAEYEKLCAEKDKGGYCEIDLFSVFRQLARGGGRNFSDEEIKKIALIFRKKSRKKLRAYAGARKLLKGLKERGAKVYLLSNAQACFTHSELAKLKLNGYFDGIILSSEFGEKKPSLKFFEGIAQKYGLDKSETVYTGNDFCADIEGARAAGYKTAYILSNLSPESDELKKAAAVANFATDDFTKLCSYLLNSLKA